MKNRQHLLISLEKRHAVNILAAIKRVELRKRTMHVNKGDVVWLYVKKPVGAVVGYAIVETCTTSTPTLIWKQFGNVSGLNKAEFKNYFDGKNFAFALGLASPKNMKHQVILDEIRTISPGFQPPQFYRRLAVGSALLNFLTKHSR